MERKRHLGRIGPVRVLILLAAHDDKSDSCANKVSSKESQDEIKTSNDDDDDDSGWTVPDCTNQWMDCTEKVVRLGGPMPLVRPWCSHSTVHVHVDDPQNGLRPLLAIATVVCPLDG